MKPSNKTYLIAIFLATFIQLLSGQNVNCNDLVKDGDLFLSNGKPYSGTCLTYFTNGNKKYSCQYVNGLKHGNEDNFYENGTLKSKTKYSEGLRDGDCSYTYYLQDGQEKSVISFDKGEKTEIIQYTPYYLYPVIVGEQNGTIKRSLLQNQKNIEVKILKTYNKYFDDNGDFDPKYNLTVTSDLRFLTDDSDPHFVKFRMKCELPIWPERESIYDHIKFDGQANAPNMTETMLANFKNPKLAMFWLTELYLYRSDNTKNYMWIDSGRKIKIVD